MNLVLKIISAVTRASEVTILYLAVQKLAIQRLTLLKKSEQ